MASVDIQQQFQAGVAALKAGERERARQLLTAVVTADEHHEQAWLWLSGAVATVADKRICLQNVLTLNPGNEKAHRNLERLSGSQAPQTTGTISQRQPLSPAAAILHPERYKPVVEMREIVAPPMQANVVYQTNSSYDDVWSHEDDICAYCAHTIDPFDDKCPGCGRNLIRLHFRYEKPSANLHIYWVMLVGIGQLFLIKMLFRILVEQAVVPAVVNGTLLVVFLVLALGIYLRQTWAFTGSFIVLVAILMIGFLDLATPLDLSQLGVMALDEAISSVAGSMIAGFGRFLDIFLITATIIALILAIFSVSPDFERVRVKQLATLRKGLTNASSYALAARRLGRAQMWAAAILHWQHAAAKEPTQWSHMLALGRAYARLGFYDRALDVLQSAQKLVSHPDRQQEITNIITAVKHKQETVT